jgi:hypothetical protein
MFSVSTKDEGSVKLQFLTIWLDGNTNSIIHYPKARLRLNINLFSGNYKIANTLGNGKHEVSWDGIPC